METRGRQGPAVLLLPSLHREPKAGGMLLEELHPAPGALCPRSPACFPALIFQTEPSNDITSKAACS